MRREAGDGSLYRHVSKRADGSERVRYRFVLAGRTYTYPSQREARDAAKRLLAERAAGVRRDDRLTTGAFLDRWFCEVKSIDGTSPNTLLLYRSYLDRKVIPALGATRLSDVTTPHLQSFLAALVAADYAPATVGVVRAMLNGAFEYARTSRLIAVNPVRDTVAPRVLRRRKVAPVIEEAAALRDLFPDPPWQAFVVLGLCYGLRISEILGLRGEDVTEREITVRGQLGRNGSAWTPRRKVDDDLTLALVPPVARALMRHRAMQPEGDLIFTRPDGRPYTQQQAYDVFRRRVRGSGLPFRTPHDMRHGVASGLASMGMPIQVVAEVLGHGTARTTLDTYTHTNQVEVQMWLSRWAEMLDGDQETRTG